MNDWIATPLEQLADISSGGTPSRANENFWGGDISWVTPSDITKCKTNYLYDTQDFITKKGLLSSSAKLLPAGTLLFTSRATIGEIKISTKQISTNQGFKNLIPKDCIDTDFLFYQIIQYKNEFVKYAAGSTFLEINRKDTGRVLISHPSDKNEQQKISLVLKTIDRTIAKTEALIEKYQQIKAGLMHDLFTRGIGADGKLRSPREEAPELYQETAIGWIPKEWEVKKCSDLCTRICVGIVIQPTQYYVSEGIPALRSANVREDGINTDNLVYISPYSNNLLVKSQVKEGDILSVRTGYPGTSAVVPNEFDGTNCIDILISTPANRIDSEYLCNWINSSFGKEQVLRQQGGMAQQHFNVGEMRQLLVALPNISEQLLIKDKFMTSTSKLKAEQAILTKLQKQKSGLMHDLLTGKVSVNVDSDAP